MNRSHLFDRTGSLVALTLSVPVIGEADTADGYALKSEWL